MIEFTGERVIPGEVNDELWAEHKARYAFALQHANDRRALDIGCGTGYGVAELASTARTVIGVDPAADAIAYARAHFAPENARFLEASAEALPFADGCFDLLTAFEVIEHMSRWRDLLAEARRVCAEHGLFFVSTPNKLYYTESRAKEGPNPFHVHEFEFAEFRDTLASYFPHLTLFVQNRVESLVFTPLQPSASEASAKLGRTEADPAEANFFVAVCSLRPQPDPQPFIFIPSASNLLREREQHIRLLEDELRQTKQWLDTLIVEHKSLQDIHVEQQRHLEEQNRWALDLEAKWRAGMERIVQLQDEFQAEQSAAAATVASYEQKLAELHEESRVKTQWALDTEQRLSREIDSKAAELVEAVRLLDRAEATVTERTLWAQGLQQQIAALEAQLAAVRDSRWVKLGRAAGLGPKLEAKVTGR